MEDNIKLYSDMEHFEIININDGEKYNYLANNDIVLDENGNFTMIIINTMKSKFGIFGNAEFLEIPWDYVKKIGSKTIIVDVDTNKLKKIHL